MKELKLKDGSSLDFTNSSTINNLITVVSDYTEVANIVGLLSADNLSECEFDGVAYTNVELASVQTIAIGRGNVQATFLTKTKSSDEIEALKKQIAELESENATLTDKAEAADILLGKEEV